MNEQRFGMKLRTHYRWEHLDKEGHLKGEGDFDNLVVTEGLNKVLDAAFKTGLATPAWLVGLIDGATAPTFLVGDVLGSHAGWTENTAYSEGARQAYVPGDIADGAVDNSASRAVFTMNADGSIAGFFITDGTVIFGEGAFSSGTRPVEIGDSLRVTATISA